MVLTGTITAGKMKLVYGTFATGKQFKYKRSKHPHWMQQKGQSP
jgi:hypothetical protein